MTCHHPYRGFAVFPGTCLQNQTLSFLLHDILRSRGKYSGFQENTAWSHWQDCCLDKLVNKVTPLLEQIDHQKKTARVRAWRKKMRDSFDTHRHGAAAFQWLRSNPTQTIRAVPAKDGSIATGTCAVLEEIMSAWQSPFNTDKLVFVAEFLPKVKHLLPTSPCEVPQVKLDQG